MLQVTNLKLMMGTKKLFDDVNLKFTNGNCYGVIGANGAGKSTFLRVLSGELEPTIGTVSVGKNERISVLSQNQNEFDALTVVQTVMMGHKRLMQIWKEKDELYAKADFSEADGMRASELESEFAELNGWEAESQAQTLLNDLGIAESYHMQLMSEVDPKIKVKILLAKALFGNPDILILDEPTNNLDLKTIRWLEDYLLSIQTTIILVSHNRHFLNRVCTHICDVDYGQISIYLGNYDFWYETSQMLARQAKEANKKKESRAKELQDFIARFSANASKSRSATSRKKELEKITIDDIRVSSRKYPFIDFKAERESGNDILAVEGLTKKGVFKDVSFTVRKNDKIAFVSKNGAVITALFQILAGEDEADAGTIKWGTTIKASYFPQNNAKYYEGCDLNLIQWLDQFAYEHTETFLRSWLGRMLFSGDDVFKKAKVLSGGEKVRCMLAKIMLEQGNAIILDEPTNHLDLESITALNKGLVNCKGNLLFATHDHEVNSTVANRIIELDTTVTLDKECTYDEYLELVEERENSETGKK